MSSTDTTDQEAMRKLAAEEKRRRLAMPAPKMLGSQSHGQPPASAGSIAKTYRFDLNRVREAIANLGIAPAGVHGAEPLYADRDVPRIVEALRALGVAAYGNIARERRDEFTDFGL